MVGAFGLSTPSQSNLYYRQANAVSKTLPATMTVESCWPSVDGSQFIITLQQSVKRDECHSVKTCFICFPLTDSHTVIAVIVPLFLFSCYLSYASSSTLCKTFLFSAITSPCHAWRQCAFPPGYQGQHGWRGTSRFFKNQRLEEQKQENGSQSTRQNSSASRTKNSLSCCKHYNTSLWCTHMTPQHKAQATTFIKATKKR